jgi:hypothetical protein
MIVWDFYPGAFGPSILAELPDQDAVAHLQDIFVQVATTGMPLDLNKDPRMRLKNIASLELARGPLLVRKTLSKTDNARFVWTCTAEQWHRHAGLLDPFLKDRVGHQYLTEEGIDDALVEVSFGEQHADVE